MYNTPNNNGASNGNSPASGTGSPSPSKQLVQIQDPTALGQVAALLEDADDNRAVSENGDSLAAAGPPAGNAPAHAGDALNAQRALNFAANVAPQPAPQLPHHARPQVQSPQLQQQRVVRDSPPTSGSSASTTRSAAGQEERFSPRF
jgi:hypothetical protein